MRFPMLPYSMGALWLRKLSFWTHLENKSSTIVVDLPLITYVKIICLRRLSLGISTRPYYDRIYLSANRRKLNICKAAAIYIDS